LTGSPFVAVLHVEVCVDRIHSVNPDSMNSANSGLNVATTGTLATGVREIRLAETGKDPVTLWTPVVNRVVLHGSVLPEPLKLSRVVSDDLPDLCDELFSGFCDQGSNLVRRPRKGRFWSGWCQSLNLGFGSLRRASRAFYDVSSIPGCRSIDQLLSILENQVHMFGCELFS
jgi:hypothetical protein